MKRITVIDSHTGGGPTRLVTAGFPDLGSGSMAERRQQLADHHDQRRAACVLEPRGSDVLVGALHCEPVEPSACAGVIFFNNSGYLGICGHGTIRLVASLAHLGKIGPGVHSIETPVGTVQATRHEDGSVSVRIVPTIRGRAHISAEASLIIEQDDRSPVAFARERGPGGRRDHDRRRNHRRGLRVLVRDAGLPGATAPGMGHLLVLDDNPAELALSQYSLQRWRDSTGLARRLRLPQQRHPLAGGQCRRNGGSPNQVPKPAGTRRGLRADHQSWLARTRTGTARGPGRRLADQ